MRSKFVVLFVLALSEAGCTGKVRHETARLAPTGLAPEDGVTVVLERFSSEVPSSPTPASEERGESTNVWTVESFEDKEDQVADCVFDALRETHPSVPIIPPEQVRQAAFPNRATATVPRAAWSWKQMALRPTFAKRMESLGLRYIIAVRVEEESSGDFLADSSAIAATKEITVLMKAEVLDLENARSAGTVEAESQTVQGILVPSFLLLAALPVPFPLLIHGPTCEELGQEIAEFLIAETALVAAARRGDLQAVERLVKEGAHVDGRDDEGDAALVAAIAGSHTPVAEHLLAHGASVNVSDKHGDSVLHLAIYNGQPALAEQLIAHGVDANARNADGDSALHLAIRKGQPMVAEQLVAHGADVNAKLKTSRVTPLHTATDSGQTAVVELLMKHGAHVNAKDNSGETPLHGAIQFGYEDIAKLLIAHGADLDTRSKSRHTPLHYAARHDEPMVVDLLLVHGADVDAKDRHGRTPLSWSSEKGNSTPAEQLVGHGANVNARDRNHKGPLHWAAGYGHVEVVALLIANGAEIDAKDKHGRTPLQWAVETEHEEVSDLLIAYGADPTPKYTHGLLAAAERGELDEVARLLQLGADVKMADGYGDSALHITARFGHKDVAELLILHGADVNAKTEYGGLRPLHVTAQFAREAITELLIDHGADVNAKTRRGARPLRFAMEHGSENVARLLRKHGAKE